MGMVSGGTEYTNALLSRSYHVCARLRAKVILKNYHPTP